MIYDALILYRIAVFLFSSFNFQDNFFPLVFEFVAWFIEFSWVSIRFSSQHCDLEECEICELLFILKELDSRETTEIGKGISSGDAVWNRNWLFDINVEYSKSAQSKLLSLNINSIYEYRYCLSNYVSNHHRIQNFLCLKSNTEFKVRSSYDYVRAYIHKYYFCLLLILDNHFYQERNIHETS